MGVMDQIKEDMRNADAMAGGARLPKIKTEYGEFLVEILKCRLKESKLRAEIRFIVEFKILESEDPEYKVDKEYAWSHDLTNKFYGASNAKEFLAACMGLDVEDPEEEAEAKENIDGDDIEEACGDDQPLEGKKVKLIVFYKETDGGRDFWAHNWRPVPVPAQ